MCYRCQGTARPIDGRLQEELQVVSDKREVLASFCYLGDILSVAGECKLSINKYVKPAWKKFKELLSVLLYRHISYKTHGCVYSFCFRNAMRDLALDKARSTSFTAQQQCHN